MADLRALTADQKATPPGKPGPDIRKKRRAQKQMRWDAKTVELALKRVYRNRAAAQKEEM